MTDFLFGIEISTAVTLPGSLIRPKYIWKDADEIYINSGVYHHHGTKEQMVYWDSQLTYQFTSLGVSDWSYLYLDDSAIVTADTNLIAAGQLIDSVTEPTWSDAKHGWYNGEDRCIFGVLTDAGSNILEFFHDGDLCLFANDINEGGGDIDLVWTDQTLTMPVFTRQAKIFFFASSELTGNTSFKWRTNGQSGTSGHTVCYNLRDTDSRYMSDTVVVIADSTAKIEVKATASDASTVSIYTQGWYFSIGM